MVASETQRGVPESSPVVKVGNLCPGLSLVVKHPKMALRLGKIQGFIMNIWGFPAFFLRCVAGLAACLFRVVYCIGLTCKNSGWRQLILQFHRRHGDILILGVCSLGIYPIGYWTLKDKDLTWFDHETMENQLDAMGFFWPAIRYNWILSKHQGLNPNIQPFSSRNMVIYHGILPLNKPIWQWVNLFTIYTHGQNQFGNQWP